MAISNAFIDPTNCGIGYTKIFGNTTLDLSVGNSGFDYLNRCIRKFSLMVLESFAVCVAESTFPTTGNKCSAAPLTYSMKALRGILAMTRAKLDMAARIDGKKFFGAVLAGKQSRGLAICFHATACGFFRRLGFFHAIPDTAELFSDLASIK